MVSIINSLWKFTANQFINYVVVVPHITSLRDGINYPMPCLMSWHHALHTNYTILFAKGIIDKKMLVDQRSSINHSFASSSATVFHHPMTRWGSCWVVGSPIVSAIVWLKWVPFFFNIIYLVYFSANETEGTAFLTLLMAISGQATSRNWTMGRQLDF